MKKKIILIMVTLLIILSVIPMIGCIEDETPLPKEEIPLPNADKIILSAADKFFEIVLYDNLAVVEFQKLLPLKIEMANMPHEKYYYLDQNLPTDIYSPKTIRAGDVMLFGTNCLVVFYETFETTYNYTPIGRIEETSGLASALGSGKVSVTFSHLPSIIDGDKIK